MNRFRKVLCVALVLLLLVASVPAVPVADLGFGGAEVNAVLENSGYVTPTGEIGWGDAIEPTDAA